MTKISKPIEIDFNPEFQRALALMEDTAQNLLITGRAGTGKSTLLNYFRDHTKKKVVVLAPTGVAAVNVTGQTIHSFFLSLQARCYPGIDQKEKERGERKDDSL